MKVVATNRRAKFDYAISEKIVAGIVLTGAEVKSIKAGHISLKGSYVVINRGELYLFNAHVSPYKYARVAEHDETRSRKLLVKKQELSRLISLKQSAMSFVPLAVGIDRGLVKVEVGIGRGQKRIDKRQAIQKRQTEREIARSIRDKTKRG